MILTYRYRLLPSKRQHAAIGEICEAQRQLYNAALEERIDCYRKTGKTISYIDQCKSLTICRRELPEMSAMPLKLERWTLKRLDDAYKAFFRRVKARDGKAGFPRFRGQGWWNSFGFNEFSGIRFDGKRLRFAGMPGGLRVHLHRPLSVEADIRSCVFTRSNRIWHVCLQIALPNVAVAGDGVVNQAQWSEGGPDHLARACESLPLGLTFRMGARGDHLALARESLSVRSERARAIGIDVGLKVFAYCSDGTSIPNPQIGRRAQGELRRRARALARCKRGSKCRRKVRVRLAAIQRKIANARSTFLHQQSAALINRSDLVAVEDLKIKNMVRSAKGTSGAPGTNVKAKAGLNRSITDASWAKFFGFLAYKAERAGVRFVTVDPRNTSQRCSGCGVLVPKSLAVRTHSCPSCGLVIDRDWNAACNILAAVVGRGADNVAHRGERRLGNLSAGSR